MSRRAWVAHMEVRFWLNGCWPACCGLLLMMHLQWLWLWPNAVALLAIHLLVLHCLCKLVLVWLLMSGWHSS